MILFETVLDYRIQNVTLLYYVLGPSYYLAYVVECLLALDSHTLDLLRLDLFSITENVSMSNHIHFI